MEQTFTIPEGFEIKKVSDNEFKIVEKQPDNTKIKGDVQQIDTQQKENAVTRHRNSFFQEPIDNRDDYDFGVQNFGGYYDRQLRESQDRDALFEERLNNFNHQGEFNYAHFQRQRSALHDMYQSGKIKKLTKEEMDLLKFCDGINVRQFIKEEFERNPIIIKTDENGYIYAETPNRQPEKKQNNSEQPTIFDDIK